MSPSADMAQHVLETLWKAAQDEQLLISKTREIA
jgi:hypothetical protein